MDGGLRFHTGVWWSKWGHFLTKDWVQIYYQLLIEESDSEIFLKLSRVFPAHQPWALVSCIQPGSKYFWHYTKCSNFMTRSECKSSQPLYVWHPMHYIWHHIHSLWHHTTLFMTSSPLYLTSHPLYVTLHPRYAKPKLCIGCPFIGRACWPPI